MHEHMRKTKAAYDADASGWTERTKANRVDAAKALRSDVDHATPGGLILDLGCGPGWHIPHLAPAIGVDVSASMTALARDHGPVAQGNLTTLPLRRESLDGIWASRSLVHVPRTEMPMALAELHRILRTDGLARVWLFEGDNERTTFPNDSLPGRTFSYWPQPLLQQAFEAAGFSAKLETWDATTRIGTVEKQIMVHARRSWSLPDFVGPDMRLLLCGLNPSPSSADSGVGFFKAGNRFWPAALQAGLLTRDRDPVHALATHGIGMTDLVKRPTRRADELSRADYAAGVERLTHLVRWLQPETICMVGLAGWRAAVDRKAERGWQPELFAGRPVYLMPSTSGLNAHDTVDTLAQHLRNAALPRTLG